MADGSNTEAKNAIMCNSTHIDSLSPVTESGVKSENIILLDCECLFDEPEHDMVTVGGKKA